MKRVLVVAAVLVCVMKAETAKVASAAAQTSIRVPLLGFAPTSSSDGLRPVWGTFGANRLDNPLSLPDGLASIWAAPGQQYAFAKRTGLGELGMLALNEVNGVGDFQSISGGLANADRVAFSPRGSSAVLYAGASQRLQVITGLPADARIASEIDGSAFPSPASIAVSDDGALVLAGFLNGGNGFVLQILNGAGTQTVPNVGSATAICFLPGAHDAVIADSQANQIILLQGDALSARILAGDAQGVSVPLDLQTSTDGSRVYVANSGAKNVLNIEVATGDSTALQCGFAPASFARLLKSVLSISAQDGTDIWLLDTDAVTPWIAYAPKIR